MKLAVDNSFNSQQFMHNLLIINIPSAGAETDALRQGLGRDLPRGPILSGSPVGARLPTRWLEDTVLEVLVFFSKTGRYFLDSISDLIWSSILM